MALSTLYFGSLLHHNYYPQPWTPPLLITELQLGPCNHEKPNESGKWRWHAWSMRIQYELDLQGLYMGIAILSRNASPSQMYLCATSRRTNTKMMMAPDCAMRRTVATPQLGTPCCPNVGLCTSMASCTGCSIMLFTFQFCRVFVQRSDACVNEYCRSPKYLNSATEVPAENLPTSRRTLKAYPKGLPKSSYSKWIPTASRKPERKTYVTPSQEPSPNLFRLCGTQDPY